MGKRPSLALVEVVPPGSFVLRFFSLRPLNGGGSAVFPSVASHFELSKKEKDRSLTARMLVSGLVLFARGRPAVSNRRARLGVWPRGSRTESAWMLYSSRTGVGLYFTAHSRIGQELRLKFLANLLLGQIAGCAGHQSGNQIPASKRPDKSLDLATRGGRPVAFVGHLARHGNTLRALGPKRDHSPRIPYPALSGSRSGLPLRLPFARLIDSSTPVLRGVNSIAIAIARTCPNVQRHLGSRDTRHAAK